MFKRSNTNKQFDMFLSPSGLMCERESREYDDVNSWHNKFYREVTSVVDENIFSVLFSSGKKDGKDGRPNAPVRILVAMTILKEGCGCSDEKLFEECRFNMLYRRALGFLRLDDKCPSIATYYNFRRSLNEYKDKTGTDLFEKCYKQITGNQIKEYNISGKTVRMDSKLIGSNIAWYSRYEIIHGTFVKEVSLQDVEGIADNAMRQMALDFLNEDAAKTVYRTNSEEMGNRILVLGRVIDHILTRTEESRMSLLRRVFYDQYEKNEDGIVTLRDKKAVSAKSVQNPNDPDAQYRGKSGKQVRGNVTNLTEVLDEGKPTLITDVQVEGATTADNTFVKKGVDGSEEVTGDKVETVHTDGAYQSEDNRRFAEDNGIELVTNGIQGKPSRFDLEMTNTGELTVTDRQSGEVITATKVKEDKWKIRTVNRKGKSIWRYFSRENVEKARIRREIDTIPFEKRKKRNNVEATIFQYCFHTRNNKTRYRGLFKQKLQALARCAWINVRRLLLFDLRINLQTI